MDNTELHYLTYDPNEIWNEMIVNYVNAGGDILYPGDEKEMLLRSVLADIVQVFAGVDNALRMQTLRYATGEYIDLIGEKRGCYRIEASPATATVTITTNATGEVGTLPAGTAMTADGVQFYLLESDLTLTGYQQTITAGVVADKPGSAGNALAEGTTMFLSDPNPAVNAIVAASTATGGNEREEDDAYKERIREFELTDVRTGPERQYESVAKSVSSDIVDAAAVNLSAGQVGVYLLLAEGASSASIIQAVTDKLSAYDVRPLTDQVVVSEATAVPYVLNVNYSCDNSSAVVTAITAAVQEYQDWQDNSIGTPFNPDKLMAALYQAGATRVTWGTGSEFDDGGEIEYTEIAANEHCSGTITLSEL